MSEYRDMDSAPKDGSTIIGLMPDGSECEVNFAQERTCMMAGYAGGYGYFGPGWEQTDCRLIVDDPVAWRPYSRQPGPFLFTKG